MAETIELVSDLPLFAFGSHLDPRFTGHLLERPIEAEPARLVDFELIEVPSLPPLACEAPGETIEGRLYRELTAKDYVRLDAYEGVAEGLHQRVVVVVVSEGPGTPGAPQEGAFVYLPTHRMIQR